MATEKPEEQAPQEDEFIVSDLSVVPLPIDVFADLMDKLPNAEDFEPVMFEIQTQTARIKVAKSTTDRQLKLILSTFEKISGVTPEDSWEFQDEQATKKGYQ